ncbi:MAG: D-alanyl-D-alanine carboxypeptidase family protein [Lachnospiraceae bacterium]
MRHHYQKYIAGSILCILLTLAGSISAYAINTVPTESLHEQAEARKSMTVETNEIDGWPDGPMIGAESAILMDVDTGIVLYEKNAHEQLYPASTTKLLTALLVIENSTMDEVVTFSHDAIFNIERNSSHIGIDVGEQLTMEQCLYGLLLGSANEVAYALAEHVGGDLDTFVDMMNERASEIGCTDTHFSNANGLPQADHYTSAYDLALIARECYKNETLAKISGTTHYTIPPTNIQTEERPLDNHHQMLTGFEYAYDGIVGGKTGYTDEARQTLVTCAQRNGLHLVCVIMKEESPNQFLDTAELFDYGFNNFQKLNIAANETEYTLNSSTFFNTNLDIIGSSKPILTISNIGDVIIPKTSVFSDAAVEIAYSDGSMESIATLTYTMGGHYVGSATIDYADSSTNSFEFANIITDSAAVTPETVEPEHKVVFVNIKTVILIIISIIGILFAVFFLKMFIKKLWNSKRRKRRHNRKRYRKRNENIYF